jgi:uroporphyrinogen-III synthase
MRLLVTRPQPGADATAAALQALGHQPLVAPLLATEALAWAPPAALPDAIIISSAAVLRHAGPGLAALAGLPALCVGAATAAAARAAGLADVRVGPGAMQPLLDGLAQGPFTRLLHLAGADRTDVGVPDGLQLAVTPVYRAVLQPLPALPDVKGVLLYSARTARHFAAEWARLGGKRGLISLFAISPAALAAAGPGWRAGQAPAQPTEAALLAMLGKAG